jgi:predicted TIM-barrel fold metal-dependent hydrolase
MLSLGKVAEGISYVKARFKNEFFGKIVDSHAHSDKKFSWQHSPEQLLAMMKEVGIKKSVLAPYWDLPAEGDPDAVGRFVSALKNHPTDFIGFLRLNPFNGKAETLLAEMSQQKVIHGLKLNPATSSALPYGEATLKLVRKAADYSLPVLFHSGDDHLSNPFQIERVAKLCPKADVIMGHMGGFFYIEEAIEVARRNKNVYLETSVMPYPNLIKLAVKKVGSDKVFFGSDSPGVHAKVELAKIYSAGLKAFDLERVLTSAFFDLIQGA